MVGVVKAKDLVVGLSVEARGIKEGQEKGMRRKGME